MLPGPDQDQLRGAFVDEKAQQQVGDGQNWGLPWLDNWGQPIFFQEGILLNQCDSELTIVTIGTPFFEVLHKRKASVDKKGGK